MQCSLIEKLEILGSGSQRDKKAVRDSLSYIKAGVWPSREGLFTGYTYNGNSRSMCCLKMWACFVCFLLLAFSAYGALSVYVLVASAWHVSHHVHQALDTLLKMPSTMHHVSA
jgi:hypothetical protein